MFQGGLANSGQSAHDPTRGNPVAGALLERDGVVAAILDAIVGSRSGRGRALFLLGEAGLGKTSLLALAQAKADGYRQGLGRGSAAEVTLPFGILNQALTALGASDLSRGTGSRPLDSRATVFHSALKAVRAGIPTLLALDDLQWADSDSLALLTFLCRRIADQPVVIVGTLRPNPEGAMDAVQRAAAEGDAAIETLAPLSPRAATELLETRTGKAVDEETARRAWEASGGNPLLLEHLATRLLPGGGLRVIGPGESALGFGLLLSRFAGVSSRAYEFARMASVLGTSFRVSDAAALSDHSARSAAQVVEELSRAGLIRGETPRTAEFVHPLFRQLLYEDIPEPVRSQHHANAFRLLAASGANISEAALHARLAGLSGDSQAIAVLTEAGRLATSAGAFSQARGHYQAAVDAAGDHAGPTLLMALGQAALASGDVQGAISTYRRAVNLPDLSPNTSVAARRLLGRALMVAGRHEQADIELNLAIETALRVDQSLAVEAQLDHASGRWQHNRADVSLTLLTRARALAQQLSPQLRRHADMAWGFIAFHMGDPAGMATVEEAARAAEADPASDLSDLAWSWGALGMWMLVARFAERFSESDRAFDIGYRAAQEARMPTAEATLAISQLDQHVRLGRLREASQLITRGAELAEVLPITAPWLGIARASLEFELGQPEGALAACSSAERLAAPYRDRLPVFWMWLGHIRGRLNLDSGRVVEAAEDYQQVEQVAATSQIIEPCVVPWSSSAIEAYVGAGRPADARRLIDQIDRLAVRLPCQWPRATAAIGRARLAVSEGDFDGADVNFRHGLGLLQKLPMPLINADAMITYGRFLRTHRHPREARPWFARALQLAETSNATRLWRLAREELLAAGGRRLRPRATLTPQETRVAQLAAEGLSDKQIGRRLSISERTVDAHLQHIYTKLAISSRRELMRQSIGGDEKFARRAVTTIGS